MAFSAIPSALPLDEAAHLLGLEPAHFHQSTADPVEHIFCSRNCEDVWMEEAWMNPSGLARQQLARSLAQAEVEVGRFLGAPLVPTKMRRIMTLKQPRYECHFTGSYLNLGPHLVNYTPYAPVPRGAAAFSTGELLFESTYNNGFNDTVVLEMDLDGPTSDEDVVFYIAGKFGDPAAQIRFPRLVKVTQPDPETWHLYAEFEPWDFIDRQLMLMPVAQPSPSNYQILSLLEPTIYIASIEVGSMQRTYGVSNVTFLYEQGPLCSRDDCHVCAEQTAEVTGVFTDGGENTIFVFPATWNAEEKVWGPHETDPCACLRWPSAVVVTYYQSYCPPTPRSELCPEVKEIVALLAGARVQVADCECECGAGKWFHSLSDDLADVRGAGRMMTPNRLNSQFGTLRGEQLAWDRIRALLPDSQLTVSHGSN